MKGLRDTARDGVGTHRVRKKVQKVVDEERARSEFLRQTLAHHWSQENFSGAGHFDLFKKKGYVSLR